MTASAKGDQFSLPTYRAGDLIAFASGGGESTSRRGCMAERRDYWTRSKAYLQVVEWLKQQQQKDHVEALPPAIDPVVADRILRRLALRGLAKKEAGKWLGTPALTHPTTIKKSDS